MNLTQYKGYIRRDREILLMQLRNYDTRAVTFIDRAIAVEKD